MNTPIFARPFLTMACSLLLASAFSTSALTHANERDLASVPPSQAGISEQGLQALTDAMHVHVDAGRLAGITTVLARNGKLVHLDSYGQLDVVADTPLREDSIFRIYSMTKPITGVALMTLYDEGKFSLDDAVSDYIPELANLQVASEDGPDGYPVTVPATHEMTIRELMSHTGGLTYGMFSQSQVDTLYVQSNILDENSTLKDMIDKLADFPLRQQPGTLWHYSVSVDVQGYLVEVLSGKPYDKFLEERIFAPLGMVDTGFYVPEHKHHRFSEMYASTPNGLVTPPPLGGSFKEPVSFFNGGGGLTSTAQDYLRFTQMVANDGELDGVRILSPEAAGLMRVNQLPEGMTEIPGYPGNSFGLDFAIVEDPARNDGMSQGSYWWWGIGGTWFWIDPVEDLIFIGLIQNRNLGFARQLQAESKQLVYSALQ